LAWLRLLRSRRVGAATFRRLLSEHGTAQAALDALPSIAAAAGERSYTPFSESAARAELAAGARARAQMLFLGAPGYPTALAAIPEAPPILWIIGDAALLARPCVALVGARNASSLGTRMARALAKELGAAGFTVVSGLARGIDAAAHAAALETGTVAVMAGGADIVYPAQNAQLAAGIAARGACLSEQPMGLEPQARHFPRRNRIVSGLCRAVIVVEAAARSGSLITARCALDQGREVCAVPGHPFDARAAGGNMLIRDGATLVRGAEDVRAALGASLALEPQLPLEPTTLTRESHRAREERATAPPPAPRTAEGRPTPAPTASTGSRDGQAAGGRAGAASAEQANPARPAPPHGAMRARETASDGERKPAAVAAALATSDGAGLRPGRAGSVAGADTARPAPSLRETAKLHARILGQLGPSPLAEDQLIRDLGRSPAEVAPALLDLELDGAIERRPGGLLSRVPKG
jgi:DNA processing protein